MLEFINWLSGRETTRDELGYRGGNPRFTPPRPPVQPGQVFYGVRVGDGRLPTENNGDF
jgi:hypothetical protein